MENGKTKYLIGMIIGLVGTAVSLFMPIGNSEYSLWDYMNSPFLSGFNEIFGTHNILFNKVLFYLWLAFSIICFIIWLVKKTNEK